MGFLNKIFGTDLKSNSTTIAIDLLTYANQLSMDDDPFIIAKYLVNDIWSSEPDIYEGKFGQFPYKLTIAIYALAKGLELELVVDTKNVIVIALTNAFSEIKANGFKYPLNSLDKGLLQKAEAILINNINEINQDLLSQETDRIVVKNKDECLF